MNERNKNSLSNWLVTIFTGIIAFTSVFYTYFTYKLLKETKESLDLTRKSFEAMRWASYGNTLQQISMNHREIAFKALESKELMKIFMPGSREELQKLKMELAKGRKLTSAERLFATALINHASMSFKHRTYQTLPSEWWDPIVKDIVDLFRHPVIRQRWKETREHYDEEFQKFINEKALKEEH